MVLKRKREEVEDEEPATQSPDVWFPDGNVILAAEKTHFLVHRSVLAMHSDYFSQMQYENVDCPIVTLECSAQDLQHLLQAIYGQSLHSGMTIPLPRFLAVLKLAHRYQFTSLRNQAQAILAHEFPTALDTWDAQARYSVVEKEGGLLYITDVQILKAAKEGSFKRSLPIIFFGLIWDNYLETIVKGEAHADGSLIELSDEDKLKCAMGYEKATTASHKTTYAWLDHIPQPTCLTPKLCTSQTQKHFYGVLREVLVESQISGLDDWDDSMVKKKKLCSVCAAYAKEAHNAGRKDFWSQLPSFFGLPPWEELVDFE